MSQYLSNNGEILSADKESDSEKKIGRENLLETRQRAAETGADGGV